jgi:hypothetical protein
MMAREECILKASNAIAGFPKKNRNAGRRENFRNNEESNLKFLKELKKSTMNRRRKRRY